MAEILLAAVFYTLPTAILFFQGNADENGRAFAFRGFDFELSTADLGAFAHPDQSQTFFTVRLVFRIKADAVVLDYERDFIPALFEQNGNIRGGGVFDDVIEGFLRDAV